MTQEFTNTTQVTNPFVPIVGQQEEAAHNNALNSNPFLDFVKSPVQLHAPDAVQAAENTEAQARRVLSYTLGKSQDAAVTAFKVREGKGIPTYTSLEDEKLATGAARELALEAMGDFSTDTVQVLGDLDSASLIHTEVPLADQFNKLLSAPADLFHKGIETINRSRTGRELVNALPRAPLNIAESAYQGVQTLGGAMQAVGMRDAGAAVEGFGRRQADVSRALLAELLPSAGRLSNEEIRKDWTTLLSDEGLAAVVGNVGDMAAKMLPTIAAYVANPAAGAVMGGSQEGAAHYEQLRRDDVPVVNSLLSAAAFGMATGLLERTGLDAMLPQMAPRTANHLVEQAMNVAGARLDQAVAQLPPKIQTAINTLRAAAVEGATEYAENPIQGALEGIAKNEDAAQIWGRALEGAKDWTPILYAGIMGGGMRAIAGRNPGTEQPAIDLADYPPEQRGVAAAIAEVAGQEAEAGQRLAFGEALSRAAEVGDATKLKGKSREAFEAAYGNLVPQDARTVFLDPQSLTSFAQGEYARSQEPVQEEGPAPTMPPDTPAQLSQLGLTVEQVQAAKASGAPVEVPLVRILSMPAGPERAALLDAVRQKPDGLTGEEARLFNPAEQLDAAALRLAERREQSRALRAEESRLRQEFMGAGFPAHVAERYTALQRANAEAFRARYGADPVETLRSRSFAQGEQAQGAAALAQAMYRNNAATLQGFVDEVLAGTPQDKKSYFGLGTATRQEAEANGAEIVLASDQVRHIRNEHPNFTAWESVPSVINQGRMAALGNNRVTGGPAYVFVFEGENGKALAVLAAPVRAKAGKQLRVLTAFEDSPKRVEHWLAEQKKAVMYQSAEETTAYPDQQNGLPSGSDGQPNVNITTFSPESKPLAQDQGMQERRGQVDFQTTPEGEVQALVTLFDSKDLSTVLHESTHIFTRQLEEIAGQGNGAAAADVRALREWAGVSSEGPLTPEEYRSFQEAVATAGEAYFMEGKAPSAKLRRVFAGFRDWLLNIYKNMRAIFSSAGFENHRLTDDVRAVFDRMLTTDDILSRSRERMDLLDGAARVNAELSLEDQAELDARLAEAAEDAVIAMNKATLRDRQKRLHEYRDIARTAVGQEQFWETVDYLSGKTGPGLDRQALEREYGKEAVRELSRARRGLVRENGLPLDLAAQEMGWQDTDALWNALYDRLALQGQSKRGQIEDMAQAMLAGDDSLREQSVDQMAGDAYGDYLDALDKSLGKLLAKKRAPTPESVKRLADSLATPRKVLIFQAQEQISRSRVSDIRPDTYNAALRKGQRRLQQALRKGDLVESLELLNAARLSNELYVQAVKARKQIEAVTRRARKAAAIKPDKIDSLAREGLRRIMERFSLARMPEGERDSAAESLSLREIINALNPDADLIMESDGSQAQAEGQNILADAFPEWLLNEAAPLTDSGPARNRNALPYGELTLTQLEDVNELVSHLEHAGRAMNRASRESEAARIEAQAVEAAAPMQGLKPVSIAEEGSAREKWQRLSRKFLSEHESLSSIFLRADGFSNIGPKGKAGVNEQELLQPLLDGENQKKLLWRDISTRMSGPVEQLVTRMADLNERFGEKLGGVTRADGSALRVPEKMRQARRSWTPEQVFGLALQMGNQSNMDRLHAGFPDLDMESVAVLLGDDAAYHLFGADAAPVDTPRPGLLTAADWRAIQGIWDAVNSLWPDTVDTRRKLYGFAPKKVEGVPMTLRVGDEVVELPGGYFPAKYDQRLSETAAARQEREDILRSGQAGFTAPAARHGHTMTRAAHAPGEALRLDLGQIMQHFEDATTFIALGPAVRHVDRVTRNPVWKAAYVRAFGEQEYNAIRENLKGMVNKERNQTAGQDIAQVFRKMVTYYGLSWNLNTVMMQTDALMKSMADQGARPVLEGLGKLLRPGALDLVRDIESVSPYMESRSRNIDRDLAQGVTDMAKQAKQRKLISLAGAAHTVEQVADVGLAPMRCMDMAVSSALWIGAYNAKMRELNPGGKAGIDTSSEHHKAAVDHADKMVKRSNPDYDATSRTKFMRDPGYSWFNMFSSAVEMIFQRQRLALQAVQAGKLSAPQYARYQLYDMILPATAFYLMGEAMTAVFGSDDDKKKRDKKGVTRRYLEGLADYAAPVIPVAGPALSSWFINGRQSQGRNVLDKPVRLGLKVGDKARALADPKLRGKKREKAERALAFSIIDLGGFFARIPVQRFAKYGEKVGNALGE